MKQSNNQLDLYTTLPKQLKQLYWNTLLPTNTHDRFVTILRKQSKNNLPLSLPLPRTFTILAAPPNSRIPEDNAEWIACHMRELFPVINVIQEWQQHALSSRLLLQLVTTNTISYCSSNAFFSFINVWAGPVTKTGRLLNECDMKCHASCIQWIIYKIIVIIFGGNEHFFHAPLFIFFISCVMKLPVICDYIYFQACMQVIFVWSNFTIN